MAESAFELIERSRAAYAEAQAVLMKIEADIAALEAEHALLQAVPMTKADYIAAMTARIQKRAGSFADAMARFSSREKFYQTSVRGASGENFYLDPFAPGYGDSPQAHTDALCFHFGEALIAGVARLADVMTWPADGADYAENAARLAQVAAELDDLHAERRALRDAMGLADTQRPPIS